VWCVSSLCPQLVFDCHLGDVYICGYMWIYLHLIANLDLTSSSATTTSAWNTHTHTCTTPSHTLSSCYGSSQAHSVNSTNRHAHPACLCRRATHRACHCPGGRPSQPSTSKSVQIHFMSTSIGVWRLTSVLSQCLQLSATHKTQQ